MSRLIKKSLSTIRHKIPAKLFIEAAKGNYAAKIAGMQLLDVNDLKANKAYSDIYISDENDDLMCLLLDSAEIVDVSYLVFDQLGTGDIRKLNFVFINSIIPDIFLQNSDIGNISIDHSDLKNCNIFSTKISGLEIRGNSRTEDLSIMENSQVGVVNISESCVGVIQVRDRSQSGVILVSQKSQTNNICITENSGSEAISISYSSSCNDILIDEHCENGGIEIENDSCGGFIVIRNSSKNKSIKVRYSSQVRNIEIYGDCQNGDIEIKDNSQNGDITVIDSSVGNLKILDNSLTGDIEIDDSKVSSIKIEGQQLNLTFNNSIIPILQVDKCCLNKLTWSTGSKGELYMYGGSLNHLALKNTVLLKDTVFSFSKVHMHVVQLENLLVQGQLILRNIIVLKKPGVFSGLSSIAKATTLIKTPDEKPSEIEIIPRLAIGKIQLPSNVYPQKLINEIKEKFEKGLREKEQAYEQSVNELKCNFKNGPYFSIANSSLGKSEITGSDLRSFNFEYRDSKLMECFLSGTQLPKNQVSIYQNEQPQKIEDKMDYYVQKVSFYNQLRKIYESLGDIVEASWYESKAMDNQQRLLNLKYQVHQKNPKWYQINKLFSEDGFNLFIFKLNKVSNNHGESWRKAFRFFLIVSILFYSLYYYSVFFKQQFSLSGTGEFIGSYFNFLDITHKQDFLVKKPTPIAKMTDFFGRLIIGYGAYQFIASFRRHSKKGL